MYERELICNPASPRFILVDGPAGYGKSRLLCQARKWYDENKPEWKAVLVDLSQVSDLLQIPLPDSALGVINLISEQLGIGRIVHLARSNWEAGLVAELALFFANPSGNVVLLFDGIEFLQPDAGDWLKRAVFGLYQGLNRINRELRVVFAGRNVKGWGSNRNFPVREIELTSFNYSTVQEMVARVAAGFHDSNLDQLTWRILTHSGAHPGAICRILKVFSDRGWVIPDLDFAFLELDDFKLDGRKGTLFGVCVEPYIHELLRGADIELIAVLQAISPVRHFNADVLVRLFDENIILRDNKFDNTGTSDWQFLAQLLEGSPGRVILGEDKNRLTWSLINRLLKARLISSPTTNSPMFSDRIVRRMLSMRLRLRDAAQHRHIHELARQIFNQWATADEKDHVDAQIRRQAIQDVIYYELMLLQNGGQHAELVDDLKNRLCRCLDSMETTTEIFQLRNALDTDDELDDLARRFLGEDAWFELREIFDEFV